MQSRNKPAPTAAERERIEKHQANIARIRSYAEKAEQPDMTAERIAAGMAQLEAIPVPTKEEWEEFAVPAADAICWALERMRITHARVLRAEQAEAEAAELRAKLASTEHTPQGANRDASAEQSHVAEGSASPTGRGADGPTAGGAAPVSHTPEGQAPQQVLKAEPATADATDRDAPAVESPSVGSMGAEQPADAGLTGGYTVSRSAPAEPAALPWPTPTDADLADPEFEAIWSVIKSWDISVPGYQGVGYCGGNGSHVMLILNALRAARGQQ